MSEAAAAMDATTMRAGLLMESVEAQQRAAESALARLSELTNGLDTVVRSELRQAFTEELQALAAASESAAAALCRVGRAASLRTAVWTLCVSGACAVAPLVIAWSVVPSTREIADLRAQRALLATSIVRLKEQGGQIEMRTCGVARRLCVRVERATAYGATGDFFVIKGY